MFERRLYHHLDWLLIGAMAALCAADFLADARLRKRVRAEFERSGGRVDVAALDR